MQYTYCTANFYFPEIDYLLYSKLDEAIQIATRNVYKNNGKCQPKMEDARKDHDKLVMTS